MKPKVRSTRDIIIQTPKLDAAVRFYKDVLGLPVTMKSDNLVGFETGSFQLFVERVDTLSPGPVLEFCVDDIEIAKQKLVAAGCAVTAEDSSIPRCYIRDPHGLVFNLTAD